MDQQYVAAAGNALLIAAGHDTRIPADSQLMVQAWATQLAAIHATVEETRRAVLGYYREPRERVIQPGDAVSRIRKERADIAADPRFKATRSRFIEELTDAKAAGDKAAEEAARKRYRAAIERRITTQREVR